MTQRNDQIPELCQSLGADEEVIMDRYLARSLASETRVLSLHQRTEHWAGVFLAMGMVVLLAAMFLSQALTPGYSMVTDDISSLGNGPAGLLYDAGDVVAGIGALLCGSLLIRARGLRPAPLLVAPLLIVLGLAVVAGGIFVEGTVTHLQAGLVAFVLAGLTPIASSLLRRGWSRYFSVVMGTVTLVMVVLTLANVPLPVADGIKERITVFPTFAWFIVFVASLARGE
jgi:hypothetical membrane protein